MQISLGDKAADSMPWTGGGESWVCWRYSYARPVVALVLDGGAAHIPPHEYELARLDATSGEFVPLELSSVQFSSPPHKLTLAVKVTIPCRCCLALGSCSLEVTRPGAGRQVHRLTVVGIHTSSNLTAMLTMCRCDSHAGAICGR